MTPVAESRSDVTTFAPAKRESPSGASDDFALRAQPSIAHRLIERFALIAFGLYHLPLFLNDYPSLGGGGFNDDGLAPRWGHVFTPVGIWVARHVFHMAGPMLDASRGDNGDVGEEFGRLLVSVIVAIVGAIIWTAADRRRPRGRWVGETLQVLLRYSIALGLASYAIAKILPVQFPPLTPIAFEDRIGDMSPMALLWRFMEYSRPYAFFGGVMEVTAVVLLCFRRTATLGALVCLAVMSNVAALNYAYGVQVKLYSTMIVLSAAALVLYDAPRLWAVFVRNETATPAKQASLFHGRVPIGLRWTIKVALVGSVIVSSFVAMMPTGAGQPSRFAGIGGAWIVTSFARNGEALESTGNAARWRRLIVDGRGVAIRLETDSMLYCGRSALSDSTIAFTCGANRKGDLRWTRTGGQITLDGTFDGAHVTASGRHLDVQDYRLLRSKFRFIYDR